MKKAVLILVILLLFASCGKSKEISKIVGKDWLLGKWENKSDEGNLLEIWTKANDSIFIGESYFIKEKDTLHSEKIQLKQKGEDLFYISTIKGQNNDKPITFKHNIEIVKQLVFENPTNDYPKKIIYSQLSKDRMIIQISGIQQRKTSSTKYSLKKTE
jgi:phosphatidylserine/phosphatidylglycerophosphate/cardiolipin synthase-like enzyme